MTMMQSSSQDATSQIFFEVEVEAPQEGLVSVHLLWTTTQHTIDHRHPRRGKQRQ